MGRNRIYHTDEELEAARKRWTKKYRERIKRELQDYRKLKKTFSNQK